MTRSRRAPGRATMAGSVRAYLATAACAVLVGALTGCTATASPEEPTATPEEPAATPGSAGPADVALLAIESFEEEAAAPLLTGTGVHSTAYVERLPGNRLRILAAGGGCLTRPVAYDRSAEAGELALLASPIPAACPGIATFTATVVALPEGFERARKFTLDGRPVEVLDVGSMTRTAEHGARLLFAPPATGGDGALVSGRLIVTAGGCAGLQHDDRELTVIWPHGTEFDGNRGLEIPGVGRVGFGDRVEGGGGYYRAEEAGDVSVRVAVGECDTRGDYARLWVPEAG